MISHLRVWGGKALERLCACCSGVYQLVWCWLVQSSFPSPLEAWDVIKLRSNGPLQLFRASRVKQHMDGASLFFVLLAGEEPLEPRFLGAVCPPRPALCWLLSGAAQSRP